MIIIRIIGMTTQHQQYNVVLVINVYANQNTVSTVLPYTYQDETGSTTCKTCASGMYNTEQGQTTKSSCKTCEPGHSCKDANKNDNMVLQYISRRNRFIYET